MDARVNMSGWVGGAVDHHAGDGERSAWSAFSLGHTPRIRRADGEWVDGDTVWLRVHCYRALAENVFASVSRGDAVLVSGTLRHRSWSDKQTGEITTALNLTADSVGHDLTRGSSVFTKRVGPGRQSEPAGPPDDDPAGYESPTTADTRELDARTLDAPAELTGVG